MRGRRIWCGSRIQTIKILAVGQYVTVPKFKLTPGFQPGDKDHPSNVKAYDIEIDMPELANVLSLGPTLQILDSNGLGFGILENSETKDIKTQRSARN